MALLLQRLRLALPLRLLLLLWLRLALLLLQRLALLLLQRLLLLLWLRLRGFAVGTVNFPIQIRKRILLRLLTRIGLLRLLPSHILRRSLLRLLLLLLRPGLLHLLLL